jgi:hypothetical protein
MSTPAFCDSVGRASGVNVSAAKCDDREVRHIAPSQPDNEANFAIRTLGAFDMIVITRNGKTTVITGWQAWLIGVVVFAVMTTLVALFAFLALGIALTLTMLFFIAVPVAIGVALIASLFRPRA